MITTLYGIEIPEPDGDLGDYRLPQYICDALDSPYAKPKAFWLRWKKKEDMQKVVQIYNEFNGITQ